MKLLVRITILFTALYFLAVEIFAFFFDTQITCDIYISLGELVICLLVSEQGKYHCRHIRWLAWAIFLSDSLIRVDMAFNFMSAGTLWVLLLGILMIAMIIMIIFAVNHFVTIKKKKGDGIIGYCQRKN